MTQLIQFFSPSFNPKGRVIFFFWGLNICGKKTIENVFPLKSLSSFASAFLFRWFSNWWFVIVTATKKWTLFFLEIILNNSIGRIKQKHKHGIKNMEKKSGKKFVWYFLPHSDCRFVVLVLIHSQLFFILNLRNILKSDMPMLDP